MKTAYEEALGIKVRVMMRWVGVAGGNLDNDKAVAYRKTQCKEPKGCGKLRRWATNV